MGGAALPPQRTENREQRTRDKRATGGVTGKPWNVFGKHEVHEEPRRFTKTARMGNRRCFFASLERPSGVHRLKPIRGRLPPTGRRLEVGSLEAWKLGGAPEVEARAAALAAMKTLFRRHQPPRPICPIRPICPTASLSARRRRACGCRGCFPLPGRGAAPHTSQSTNQ